MKRKRIQPKDLTEHGNLYQKFKNEENGENITYFGAFKDEKFRQVCSGRNKLYGWKQYKRKMVGFLPQMCHMVHHFHPFLLSGPVHIEVDIYKPFRSVFHDFFASSEMSWIMDYTRPQLSNSRESEVPNSTIEFTMKRVNVIMSINKNIQCLKPYEPGLRIYGTLRKLNI